MEGVRDRRVHCYYSGRHQRYPCLAWLASSELIESLITACLHYLSLFDSSKGYSSMALGSCSPFNTFSSIFIGDNVLAFVRLARLIGAFSLVIFVSTHQQLFMRYCMLL